MGEYLNLLAVLGIGGAHPGGLALTKCVLDQEQPLFGKKVLDAGCGTGQTLYYLMQLGADAKGIDQDQRMIQKAESRLGGSKERLQCGSLENLPYKDHTFDLVLSESVLSFTDAPKSLTEIHRVLKPGGRLVMIEMTAEPNLPRKDREKFSSFYSAVSLNTNKDWERSLKETGFYGIDSSSLVDYELDIYDQMAEFDLDEDADPALFTLLDRHQEMTKAFSKKVRCMIYRCSSSS
ncbi:methyltransferase domain-containing protein [Metabacillus sp. GX 13764]|uniref:class I SAM-dependent methyltransferase n=1 Tax=Metabacillus kandeliae TaxID=2900151 RepID=UPI001E4AFCA1|nr:class I SAM-dependent methyltransferase [Metabacillus kandeliae]MCD7033504.1 methyltransferase domain-containing protein [Metabacillus kandeliae]